MTLQVNALREGGSTYWTSGLELVSLSGLQKGRHDYWARVAGRVQRHKGSEQGSGPQVLHVVPSWADGWSLGPGTAGGSEEVAAVAPARVPTVPCGPQQLL